MTLPALSFKPVSRPLPPLPPVPFPFPPLPSPHLVAVAHLAPVHPSGGPRARPPPQSHSSVSSAAWTIPPTG